MKSPTELRAIEIMARSMISVPESAPIREVAALLVDHEISGAPVRDEIGRIVGLVSLRDIARFERERSGFEAPEQFDVKVVPGITGSERRSTARPDLEASLEIAGRIGVPYGYHVEMEEPVAVREIMTPIPITVAEDFDLRQVARAMLEHRVHRVLVRDADGEITGLVSSLDVMRALCGLDALVPATTSS